MPVVEGSEPVVEEVVGDDGYGTLFGSPTAG